MEIIKTHEVEISKTPHKVAVRKLYSFKHATFVNITLKPGESLKKHITPVDATFYILKGEGKVEIGDETKAAEAGDLIYSPAKIVHRLYELFSKEINFSLNLLTYT
jgi:quercetin dioxygenase-like cupin family protein